MFDHFFSGINAESHDLLVDSNDRTVGSFSTRKEGYGGRSISKSLSKRVWLGKNCESVPKKGSNRVYSLALTKRLFIPPPSLDIFAKPPRLGISLPGLFLRLFRAPPPLSCRRFPAAVALLTNPCHHAVLPCCHRPPIVDAAPQPRALLVLPQPPSGQG